MAIQGFVGSINNSDRTLSIDRPLLAALLSEEAEEEICQQDYEKRYYNYYCDYYKLRQNISLLCIILTPRLFFDFSHDTSVAIRVVLGFVMERRMRKHFQSHCYSFVPQLPHHVVFDFNPFGDIFVNDCDSFPVVMVE